MRILTGKKWRGGFLDYFCNKNEYRIQVLAWKNLEKLENVYHTRQKSLRLLLNYFPVVGPYGLFAKTWSRLREERRNEKYISCGIGRIIESADSKFFLEGDLVSFIAPWHPALIERIVLPKELIFKIDKSDMPEMPVGEILYSSIDGNKPQDIWWKDIKAWSVYSGTEISKEMRNKLTEGLKKEIKKTDWINAQKISIQNAGPVAEIKGELSDHKIGDKKNGVLFGYGNYAKINIIPYTKPFVNIKSVHEIDPTQIFFEQGVQRWDSSAFARKDEK